MISGKAVLNFGDGSVMVTPLCNNTKDEKIGAVCFNKAESGEINRRIPVVNQEFSKEASVVMTFSKAESIDVVIEALIWLKNTMNNVTPETDRIEWEKPFNLDILEEEEMKKELTQEIKRYAKTILAAPAETKEVKIFIFAERSNAESKSARMKTWPYKVITRARDDNGRFTKNFALICCK